MVRAERSWRSPRRGIRRLDRPLQFIDVSGEEENMSFLMWVVVAAALVLSTHNVEVDGDGGGGATSPLSLPYLSKDSSLLIIIAHFMLRR